MKKFVPLNYADYNRMEILRKRGLLTTDDVESSWERVFDLRAGKAPFWKQIKQREIQACVKSLKLDDVVEVTHFVAR